MVHLNKEQLLAQGVKASEVGEQLKCFQKGFPFAKLIKPAKISEGIISLNVTQKKNYGLFMSSVEKPKKR